MRRPTAVAILLLLAVAAPSFADLGLPKNLKIVTPRVRFDGIAPYSDHVFFLKYYSTPGNPFAAPPRHVEVKNGVVFEMPGGRRIAGVQLFAVPREEADKLREKDPTLAWLDDQAPGLKAKVTPPSTTAPSTAKEAPVTAYRVTIKGETLTVEMLPAENKRSEAPGGTRLRTAIIGVAMALSFTLFGTWFGRRRIRGGS